MNKDLERISLAGVFEAYSDRLTQAFQETQKAFTRSLDRGTGREEALRGFLQSNLPKRYGVGTGFVVNSGGIQSRQIDIVIYDALTCPVFAIDKTHNAFPVEGVYAAIEVKSTLTPVSFRQARENAIALKEVANTHLASLEDLPSGDPRAKRIPPFATCFAYRVEQNWGRADGRPWQMTVIEELSQFPLGHSLDFLCANGEGIIAQLTVEKMNRNKADEIEWDGKSSRWMLAMVSGVSPFAVFYLHLLGLLGRIRGEEFNTMRYLAALMKEKLGQAD